MVCREVAVMSKMQHDHVIRYYQVVIFLSIYFGLRFLFFTLFLYRLDMKKATSRLEYPVALNLSLQRQWGRRQYFFVYRWNSAIGIYCLYYEYKI